MLTIREAIDTLQTKSDWYHHILISDKDSCAEINELANAFVKRTAKAELYLAFNSLNVTSAKILFDALKKSSAITDVKVGFIGLSVEVARIVADVIEENYIALKGVEFFANIPEVVNTIADALKKNIFVAHVEVNLVDANKPSVQAIAAVIQANLSLRSVSIYVRSSMADSIIAAIKESKTILSVCLQIIDMNMTNIHALKDCLKEHPLLQELNLVNQLTTEEFVVFISILETNTILKTIHLCGKNMGNLGMDALLKALNQNKSSQLCNLDLNTARNCSIKLNITSDFFDLDAELTPQQLFNLNRHIKFRTVNTSFDPVAGELIENSFLFPELCAQFSSGTLSDEQAEGVAQIIRLNRPGLKSISLWGCNITDSRAVVILAALKGNMYLTSPPFDLKNTNQIKLALARNYIERNCLLACIAGINAKIKTNAKLKGRSLFSLLIEFGYKQYYLYHLLKSWSKNVDNLEDMKLIYNEVLAVIVQFYLFFANNSQDNRFVSDVLALAEERLVHMDQSSQSCKDIHGELAAYYLEKSQSLQDQELRKLFAVKAREHTEFCQSSASTLVSLPLLDLDDDNEVVPNHSPLISLPTIYFEKPTQLKTEMRLLLKTQAVLAIAILNDFLDELPNELEKFGAVLPAVPQQPSFFSSVVNFFNSGEINSYSSENNGLALKAVEMIKTLLNGFQLQENDNNNLDRCLLALEATPAGMRFSRLIGNGGHLIVHTGFRSIRVFIDLLAKKNLVNQSSDLGNHAPVLPIGLFPG